jgi:hypothetical protein
MAEAVKNKYEIRNRFDEVLFTATPEMYRDIVAQTLTAGRYTHTFEIFRDPALSVTFRTISESERQDLMKDIKKAYDDGEGEAKADLMAVSRYMLRLTVAGADVPVSPDDPATLDRLRNMPANLMDKLATYHGVFTRLVSMAFDDDDVVKN